MRIVLDFDTKLVIPEPDIREVVDGYLAGEYGGIIAAIKLGWEFSVWQAYMAEAINLAVYLAHQSAKNSETTESTIATISCDNHSKIA
jgi:hypothetical protein